MKIKFWGVRGSLPTPLSSEQVKSKITAAIQRISLKDLESNDTREKFISTLPDWLYGTTGGNTSCVTLSDNEGHTVVLDAGTGIKSFGESFKPKKDTEISIFLSHLHWDHIQGFPFFETSYNPNVKINFYSCHSGAKDSFYRQQNFDNFPVTFENLQSKIDFKQLSVGETSFIDGFEVNSCKMNHPGDSYAYAFSKKSKKVVYATDSEIKKEDFEESAEREKVFRNADVIIIDSQYTVEEASRKENWGHTAFCNSIDFAAHWGISTVFLFHHEPNYDDKKLNTILDSARWYAEFILHKKMEIYLATENLEFEI